MTINNNQQRGNNVSRNQLNTAQKIQLAAWVQAHAKTLDGMTSEQQDARASAAMGFPVTRSNLVAIRAAIKADFEIPYAAPATKKPAEPEETRDTTVAYLGLAVKRLYVDLGLTVPSRIDAIASGAIA
jgi:hypothetical protein